MVRFPLRLTGMTAALLSLTLLSHPVLAQKKYPKTTRGMTTVLPEVPRQSPRMPEGPDASQRWQVELPEGTAPLASFVDSLKGNDAAIHVVVEQGRLLTVKEPIAGPQGAAAVAIGDPTIVDFELLPNPRMLRLIGLRAGITDLSITTDSGEVYNFEVYVGWDLELLGAQLRQSFPDARLKLAQLREHVVVEGEARSPEEVSQIIVLIEAFLKSMQPKKEIKQEQDRTPSTPPPPQPGDEQDGEGEATPESVRRPETKVEYAAAQIINLIRVPGVHQVMLQVRIGELDREAIRQIGGDFLYLNDRTGTTIGTQIGGAGTAVDEDGFLRGLALGTNSTLFGVFPTADFEIILNALRQNKVLNLLAEPNLVAMSGHQANFLAGGEFPVPVPQGGGGLTNSITVEWKDFGVLLNFVPFVMDDESIRLHVAPEVSSIDESLGTTLVVGGDPIPGVNTRRSETTVELKQGQTLAIAGLLQVGLEAETARIPGLGDLPYIGPLFSSTSHQRMERELIVLVTPFLISPMCEDQVPPLPGSEIKDPNDLEFYLMNRIEGRTGRDFRPTTAWDNPLGLVELMKLESRHISGPVGYSN